MGHGAAGVLEVIMNDSSGAALDSLEEQLVSRWKSGSRTRVEELLASTSAPRLTAEELWRLVSREIALARECDLTVSAIEYGSRFPQLASRLRETLTKQDSDASEAAGATRIYVPADIDSATITTSESDVTATSFAERPREFGDYEILGEIARGGMGVVYRARQKGLNRTVALKMILAGQLASESNVRRFYSEAEAAAGLDHSGIVPIYEVGQRDSQHFFSMAYVDGQSLHDRLKKGPLSPREAATLLAQVADAVHFAHSRGIIHRDLKPQNILLDSSGHPKVTDFGLAKRMDGGEGLTQSGDVLGTPSYMAPEQAEGRVQEQGPLVDVYALGAVMYAALTGRPPFQAASLMEVLRLVVRQEPVAPRLLNAAIPQDLDTICLKCLHKDPHRRYASAGDLRDDLKRYLDGMPINARPVGSVERLARWCRRNPVVASLVGLLATVLVAAAVIASAVAVQMRSLARSEADANQKAQQNATREREARFDAEKAEQSATEAKKEAIEARLAAERRLAESFLFTGRELCDQRQIPAGLLWMTRGLRALPAGSEVLEQTIRANLGAWLPRLHSVAIAIPLPAAARDAAFHPQGKLFATAGNDGFVRVWSTEGNLVATSEARHDGAVTRIAFSPDGSRIVSGGGDRAIRFWETATGKEAAASIRETHPVTAVAFHPQGETVLVGTASGREGGLRFWNIATSKATSPAFDTKEGVLSVSISRSGRWIVTGGIRAGNDIGSGWAQVWDAQTGAAVGNELRQRFRIVTVDISPDEKLIATGSWDAEARLWERESSRPVGAPLKHLGSCYQVRFSEDGRRIVSTAQDRAYLWDVATGEPLGQRLVTPDDTFGLAFRPDGKQVLMAGSESVAWLWNLAGDEAEPPLPESGTTTALASGLGFSPDGQLAIADGHLFKVAVRRPIGPRITPNPELVASFSPDGTRVVAGTRTGQAQVLQVEPRRPIGKPLQHAGAVIAAVFSPDGSRVGTVSHDGTARLWMTETGDPVGEVMRHPNRVWGGAFQPGGSLFVTTCQDGRVRFWDGRTGTPSGEAIDLGAQAYETAFHPDGRRIATGGFDRVVRFWDVETRKEIGTPLAHESPINRLAFGAAGDRLATAGVDGGLRLWSVRDGQRIGPIGWHDGQVVGMALRPDASIVLSATEHGHAWLRKLPGSLEGTPDDIERTINLSTREELSDENVLRPLNFKRWNALKGEGLSP